MSEAPTVRRRSKRSGPLVVPSGGCGGRSVEGEERVSPDWLLLRHPGETLSWLRRQLRLSQRPFAVRIGVPPSVVVRWEQGTSPIPRSFTCGSCLSRSATWRRWRGQRSWRRSVVVKGEECGGRGRGTMK